MKLLKHGSSSSIAARRTGCRAGRIYNSSHGAHLAMQELYRSWPEKRRHLPDWDCFPLFSTRSLHASLSLRNVAPKAQQGTPPESNNQHAEHARGFPLVGELTGSSHLRSLDLVSGCVEQLLWLQTGCDNRQCALVRVPAGNRRRCNTSRLEARRTQSDKGQATGVECVSGGRSEMLLQPSSGRRCRNVSFHLASS